MTTPDDRDAAAMPPAQDSDTQPSSGPTPGRATTICPYLRAPAGWRAISPSRDHRCTAVEPPARLSGDKQARLCLVAGHVECATFVAAAEARAARGLAPRADRRPLARTIPTVLEPARPRLAWGMGASGRRLGQGGIALLAVLAIAAIVLARLGPAGATVPSPIASASLAVATPLPSEVAASSMPASAGPTLVPSPVTTPSASAQATRSPSPAPSGTASPTPTPAATPLATQAPTPAPGTYVRYTVKAGDTLSGIAARYKTTVQGIVSLNNLKTADYLRIGQVLLIPK